MVGSIACAGTSREPHLVSPIIRQRNTALTVVYATRVRRAENPGFVIVRKCTSTSEDFGRAGGKKSLVMDGLNIHVVEYLDSIFRA